MKECVIKNGMIVNRGEIIEGDLHIKGDRIEAVGPQINLSGNHEEIDATGKWVIPGIIDDQVHFREPGLTHKADISTESRAAVVGGVTAFMEMPNTKPQSLTQALLEEKYQIASRTSPANYSFYMGASNENLEHVLQTDKESVCGVKIFMGSSTGNMLVDDTVVLEKLFSNIEMLIATHCEDEATVRSRRADAIEQYGRDMDATKHPIIRNTDACYISSSKAVALAKKHGTRLHILHISTAKELELFRNDIHRKEKKITAEACVHHLFFEDSMYPHLGNKMICNPAIKSIDDRQAIRAALADHRIDVIATDHAPHTVEEKSRPYLEAPSGLPLVQHTLDLMLKINEEEQYGIPFIVDKMCHAVADCFHIRNRGYLDEGNYADIVIVNPNDPWQVHRDQLLYKCGWSPLEGQRFNTRVEQTIVNGEVVYKDGKLTGKNAGMRMQFH